MSTENISRFGKYLLLEKIASGGMAEIYLARSAAAEGLKKFVAVKKILPHLSKEKDFISLFKQEAQVALNLNHSAIVTIFDFGLEENQHYLVMEYVPGKTLLETLDLLRNLKDYIPIQVALYILKEVCAGLDYAHRCVDATTGKYLNIIHRDMDPQNIMISFEGMVKIIDFGIAKADSQTTKTTRDGFVRGKVAYMSPEQASGATVDKRTDIFSAGVILWEMLAHRRLFRGKNDLEILSNVRKCKIPSICALNPKVTPELEKIILKALSIDPNDRYQSAAELNQELAVYLSSHYPGFSDSVLSEFMKTLFASDYIKNREKLVSFAEMSIEELAASKNPDFFNIPPPISTPAEPEEDELPEGFFTPATELSQIKKSEANFSHLLEPNKTIIDTRINDDLKILRRKVELLNNTTPKPYRPKISAEKVDFNLHKEAAETTKYFKYVSYVLLCIAVYSTYKFVFKDFKISSLTKVRDANKVLTPTNNDTPVQATATPVSSHDATEKIADISQQKKVRYAYVTIRVEGTASNIEISVNGQAVASSPPILMYPIKPDEEAVISAYDPSTQLYGEQKVLLSSGEKSDVTIFLNQKK